MERPAGGSVQSSQFPLLLLSRVRRIFPCLAGCSRCGDRGKCRRCKHPRAVSWPMATSSRGFLFRKDHWALYGEHRRREGVAGSPAVPGCYGSNTLCHLSIFACLWATSWPLGSASHLRCTCFPSLRRVATSAVAVCIAISVRLTSIQGRLPAKRPAVKVKFPAR